MQLLDLQSHVPQQLDVKERQRIRMGKRCRVGAIGCNHRPKLNHKRTWGKRPVPAEVPTALTPHSMLARMADPFIWMRPRVLAKG